MSLYSAHEPALVECTWLDLSCSVSSGGWREEREVSAVVLLRKIHFLSHSHLSFLEVLFLLSPQKAFLLTLNALQNN